LAITRSENIGRDELLLVRGERLNLRSQTADEQAAVASLWRALVVRCFKVLELGRDVGLA
jgi:hypothetical protein